MIPSAYDNNNSNKDFIKWLSHLKWSYPTATAALKSPLVEYAFFRTQYLQIGNELRSYARTQYKTDYYLLCSVPGIGQLIAIGILAEVGDLKRFQDIDKLASYISLVPSVHSTGEKCYSRGITFRSKHLLRSYIIEAAWVAAKKDPQLMHYYEQRKGGDHKKMIIKLAEKILNRIYHVIKTGEPYKMMEPVNIE